MSRRTNSPRLQRRAVSLCAAALLVAAPAGAATVVRGYGVNEAGTLFHFDLNAPGAVTEVGNLGFLPEGIDFRPGTSTLYALDVGPNTTQLYTVDISNASSSAVGTGFASSGAFGPNSQPYNLLGNQTFGFDFNPTTLQPDNSMRIRLVGSNGTNIRLHSATGNIAAVDGNLAFANGDSAFVDAAAYINNLPTAGGPTTLYDLDSRNDDLLIQSPPNNGTLVTVGGLGATVDAERGIGFDVYTAPGSVDPTAADDMAWAVIRRPDAPINGPLGAYLLYRVNLATGQITNGALVGPAATPADFTGGFAILPIPQQVPAPGAFALLGLGLAGLLLRQRRRG